MGDGALTLYTSNFQYNPKPCHMQTFSDDSAVVGCVSGGKETEYWELVDQLFGMVWEQPPPVKEGAEPPRRGR